MRYALFFLCRIVSAFLTVQLLAMLLRVILSWSGTEEDGPLMGLLLMLTEWLADLVDVGFHVTGFWPAVGGAVIISITTWLLDAFLDIGD